MENFWSDFAMWLVAGAALGWWHALRRTRAAYRHSLGVVEEDAPDKNDKEGRAAYLRTKYYIIGLRYSGALISAVVGMILGGLICGSIGLLLYLSGALT